MRYLGGKSKIAQRLAKIIGGGNILIEPFCGGGAMTAALAPRFDTVRAYDVHPDLIALWQALQNGWTPPTTISENDYEFMKNEPVSARRGFVGFAGASWGGKWFGGYARGGSRNYADEASRSLLRDIKKMSNVTFALADYSWVPVEKGDVVYADPPYANTTGYATKFSSEDFWDVAQGWARSGATVFVSEYAAPPGWACVWELERTRDLKSDLRTSEKVVEKLFMKTGSK